MPSNGGIVNVAIFPQFAYPPGPVGATAFVNASTLLLMLVNSKRRRLNAFAGKNLLAVNVFVPVKTFVPLISGTLDESLASSKEPEAILPAERLVIPAPFPESVLAALVIITVPV